MFVELFNLISKQGWGNMLNKKNDIYINMQKEVFKGNILDIGLDSYGIIYSIYKQYNDEAAIDYIHGNDEKSYIIKESYDSCVMLFSFNNIWMKFNKKVLIKDIYNFLKEDGEINIWDINKGYSKIFNSKIKILLPDNKIKEIDVVDFNFLKDSSIKSVKKLLEEYFEIIDLKCSDNIYYIKGKKRKLQDLQKGNKKDEGSISSSKLKVYSQQLGSKVFKRIHK